MYLSVKHIAERLDCSTRTVERLIRSMKQRGRFNDDTFLEHPRRIKWEDVLKYAKEVET